MSITNLSPLGSNQSSISSTTMQQNQPQLETFSNLASSQSAMDENIPVKDLLDLKSLLTVGNGAALPNADISGLDSVTQKSTPNGLSAFITAVVSNLNDGESSNSSTATSPKRDPDETSLTLNSIQALAQMLMLLSAQVAQILQDANLDD
jgi:hypothetical protein